MSRMDETPLLPTVMGTPASAATLRDSMAVTSKPTAALTRLTGTGASQAYYFLDPLNWDIPTVIKGLPSTTEQRLTLVRRPFSRTFLMVKRREDASAGMARARALSTTTTRETFGSRKASWTLAAELPLAEPSKTI